jgi:hypothetical protein
MALTFVGCGMGSVHPGEKARIASLGFGDEILAVTAEDGDYRQVHRQNGTDLWVAWQYLSFVDFK